MLEPCKAWLEVVASRLQLTDVENPCTLAAPRLSHQGAHAGPFAGFQNLSAILPEPAFSIPHSVEPAAEEMFSFEKKLDVCS